MKGAAEDWRPSCSLEMLRQRAELRKSVRRFFDERDYMEVDVPALSHDVVVDAHLDPITAEIEGDRLFLQTSPEAAMKRLLAAGSGSIYTITSAFRAGEQGALHNPEFTMLEWYGVHSTWQDQLKLIEQLIRTAANDLKSTCTALQNPDSYRITTYQQAFSKHLSIDMFSVSDLQLKEMVAERCVGMTERIDRDDLLNLLLATEIEPLLGTEGPEFLIDYPASQAALAELSAEDDRVARRFELYVNGVEICNAYQELTDPQELRHRDIVQHQRRESQGSPQLPGAQRLLAAMESGIPACSGVALGFDRLLMLITGSSVIAGVLPFPIDRA
jgi:lysyl-tRNA synthetase class 2